MALEDTAPPLTSWKSYDYFPGGHVYRDTSFSPAGGPDGRPCLWADDSLWAIDTPEQPHSILFLIHYRFWDSLPPLDLRQAELRFRLRGDDLALHGARCHFWAVSYAPNASRWHFIGQALPISQGRWGEECVVRIEDDPGKWHHSFSADPASRQPLEATLATCFSYGFSFVGFSHKVTGRVGLADFQLWQEVDPCWPYIFKGRRNAHDWLTVSRTRRSQIAASSVARLDDDGLYLGDDLMVIGGLAVPFVYLAFLRAGTMGQHDLRNALLLCRHDGRAFNPMGGKIFFFVEHAASGTRWALRVELACLDTESYCERLVLDPAYWLQVSGCLPLEAVLGGCTSSSGYDYIGFLLLDPQGNPSGTWGLQHFSIGPTIFN